MDSGAASSCTPAFSFLRVDVERKGYILLGHYLALGQFELARACMQQLYREDPGRLLRLLSHLVQHGPPSGSWLATASIPSAAHLAWLCYAEYFQFLSHQEGGPQSTSAPKLPPPLLENIEFELLLHHCFASEKRKEWAEAVEDIRDVWQKKEKPTGKALKALNHVLKTQGEIGLFLLLRLSQRSSAHNNDQLVELFMKEIEQLWEEHSLQSKQAACSMLPLLGETAYSKVDQLFAKMQEECVAEVLAAGTSSTITTSSPEETSYCPDIGTGASTVPNSASLSAQMKAFIYQALLVTDSNSNSQQPTLLHHYVQAQDQLIDKTLTSHPFHPFLMLSANQQQGDKELSHLFWDEFYSVAMNKGMHFLDVFFAAALGLLRQAKFQELGTVARLFPKLRLLLFLVAWDSLPERDVHTRQNLIDLFWPEAVLPEEGDEQETADPLLLRQCRYVVYQTKVAQWCCDKLLLCPSPVPRDPLELHHSLVAALQQNSLLYILRPCLPVLDPDELRALILADPNPNPIAKQGMQQDADVVSGYFILRTILSLFQQFHHRNTRSAALEHRKLTIEKGMAFARGFLRTISSLQRRLVLLEDIYCLLLSKESHFKSHSEETLLTSSSLNSPRFLCTTDLAEAVLYLLEEDLLEIGHPVSSTDRQGAFRFTLKEDGAGKEATDNKAEKEKEGGEEKCSQQLDAEMQARAESLWNHVQEAKWRLASLLRYSSTYPVGWLDRSSHMAASPNMFMLHMIAEPKTLLMMWLRRQELEECNRVISFFGLQNSLEATEVQLTERLSNFIAKRKNSSSIVDISPLLEDMPSLEAFCVALDVTCAAPHSSSQLLHKAATFLAQHSLSPDQSRESSTRVCISAELLPLFSQSLERVTLLSSYAPFLSNEYLPFLPGIAVKEGKLRLRTICSLPIGMPPAIPDLKGMLEHRKHLSEILRELYETAHGLAHHNNYDAFLANASEALNPYPRTEQQRSYLPIFLQYLRKLGQALKDDPVCGADNYLDHLKKAPQTILSILMFEANKQGCDQSKGYEKAEQFASLLGLNLVSTLLNSLSRPSVVNPKRQQGVRNDSSLIQATSSVSVAPVASSFFDTMKKSRKENGTASINSGLPHTMPSVQLPNNTAFSTTNSQTLIGDQEETNQASFPLNMEIVHYLGRFSPVIASLACMLLTPLPSHRFESKFFDYALSHSKTFPALHNWVRLRTHKYALFCDVFLPNMAQASALNFGLRAPQASSHSLIYQEELQFGEANELEFNLYPSSPEDNFSSPEQAQRSSVSPHALHLSPFTLASTTSSLRRLDKETNRTDQRDVADMEGTPTSKNRPTRGRSQRTNSNPVPINITRSRRESLSGFSLSGEEEDEEEKAEPSYSTPKHSFAPSTTISDAATFSYSYKALPFFHQQRMQETTFLLPPSRRLSPEEESYFHLLCTEEEETSLGESCFAELTLEKLIENGQLEQALEFADTTLPDGAPDSLLKRLIESSEDKTAAWAHVIRLRDIRLATQFVLVHLKSWDIGICIDVLNMCKCRLERENNTTTTASYNDKEKEGEHPSDASVYKLLEKVHTLYSRMQVFRQILRVSRSDGAAPWRIWQSLDDDCRKDPISVVRALMRLKEWEHARKLADLFSVSDVMNEIEEARLVFLLVTKNDPSAALQGLACLSKDEILAIVQSLLKQNVPTSIKLFLIQYVLGNLRASLSSTELQSFLTKELGTKMLLLLGTEYQTQYNDLVDHPSLLLESLVMSELIAQVGLLFAELPQLRDDELIIRYAIKALSFPPQSPSAEATTNIKGSSTSESSSTKREGSRRMQQVMWVLTGDFSTDADLRTRHAYINAPSVNLGQSLLDLISEARKAAETCLELCDDLSSHLSRFGSNENLHSIGLIQQLLLYAKLKFLSCMDSNGVSLCDTILSHVDLLQALIGSKCEVGYLSLRDLSDKQKARQLRDKLVHADRMKMAIDVATKCGIEAEPVWAKWGIALLKMGRYNDAKEKFKYCLAANDKHSASKTHTSVVVDSAQLLQRIIRILEYGPPLDARELRTAHQSMLCSHAAQIKGTKLFGKRPAAKRERRDSLTEESPKSLDSMRFKQCVYYLRRYGASRQLISFWTRHGMLEDACVYVVNHNLSPSVFIEEIFQYSISHGRIPELKQVILKIGMELCAKYLLALCKYLNTQQAFLPLLDFQLFMHDYIRAGLTCIKLFQKTADMQEKLQHLTDAQEYFLVGLQELQAIREADRYKPAPTKLFGPPILNQSELTKFLKTVKLQIEVSKFFFAQSKNSANLAYIQKYITNELSLFGTKEQKTAIAEHILVLYNYDLAFRIMQDYRLSLPSVYRRAIAAIIRRKQSAKIFDLLKQAKGTINDTEWDSVVLEGVRVLVLDFNDIKTGEKLAAKLVSEESKGEGLLLCNKLKSAYLSAVKRNDVEQIRLILSRARKTGDKTVVAYCENYLANK
ncbi:Nuclear pore complex protein Nup85 [Balamuthia mandrillaris]